MPATSQIMVNIFDGRRLPYSGKEQLLITLTNGANKQISRDFHKASSVLFEKLKVADNLDDNYTILASAKGFKDAGVTPVRIVAKASHHADLMLLPKNNTLNFGGARWDILGAKRLDFQNILANGAGSPAKAAKRYGDLMEEQSGEVLACLLNLMTSMEQIHLAEGTVLSYLKSIIWKLDGDSAMARDRFFGWMDAKVIEQMKRAAAEKLFEPAPHSLHPGATLSYKQIQFDEANLQLTFHEKDRKVIDGVDCIKVEPDIDYFRDPLSHLLIEVAVNAFGAVTDPRTVYVLRWIAGQKSGVPQFDPLYTIEAA